MCPCIVTPGAIKCAIRKISLLVGFGQKRRDVEVRYVKRGGIYCPEFRDGSSGLVVVQERRPFDIAPDVAIVSKTGWLECHNVDGTTTLLCHRPRHVLEVDDNARRWSGWSRDCAELLDRIKPA